jgi:hypothetical protein
MTSNFNVLWGELKKLTPMTVARDFNFERDRKDIMKQLGMLGPVVKKKGVIHVELNKHHGKKARALENGAHQDALHQDNKTSAARRLEVQALVHEVASKQAISKELAKYVQAQEPIPSRLLRELTGAKLAGKKTQTLPPLHGKGRSGLKADTGYVPPPTDHNHQGRQVTALHSQCSNKWPVEERNFLVQLYRELDKPTNAQVALWKIYYDRLADRFRSLYPHRQSRAIIEKLHEMIAKKQFHDEKEVAHWQSLQSAKASSSSSSSSAPASVLGSPSKTKQPLVPAFSSSSVSIADTGIDPGALVSNPLNKGRAKDKD